MTKQKRKAIENKIKYLKNRILAMGFVASSIATPGADEISGFSTQKDNTNTTQTKNVVINKAQENLSPEIPDILQTWHIPLEDGTIITAQEVADSLIRKEQNTLKNFDLADVKFNAEELQYIKPDQLMQNIKEAALKGVSSRAPQEGEQTYCFRAIKKVLQRAGGIVLESNTDLRHARQGIEAFQNNENFVEIKFDIKDVVNTPDGTILVHGGNSKHPSGHAGSKIGDRDISDRGYKLSTYEKFGKPHPFVSANATLTQKDKIIELIENNKLKDDVLELSVQEIKAQRKKDFTKNMMAEILNYKKGKSNSWL